jgi:hypothetical protein
MYVLGAQAVFWILTAGMHSQKIAVRTAVGGNIVLQ